MQLTYNNQSLLATGCYEKNDSGVTRMGKEAIKEIINADIADVNEHNLTYDGTRAIDGGGAEFREGIASGGKAIKFRCFVTKYNAEQFPGLVKLINELQSKKNHEKIL